jgi:hypothetical protein
MTKLLDLSVRDRHPRALTQQRMTEGSKQKIVPVIPAAPSPDRLYHACGAPAPHAQLCAKCGQDLSGNMVRSRTLAALLQRVDASESARSRGCGTKLLRKVTRLDAGLSPGLSRRDNAVTASCGGSELRRSRSSQKRSGQCQRKDRSPRAPRPAIAPESKHPCRPR